MSRESTKKIGIFTALMMMIGSIIGTGIFFKSGGVLRDNNYNGIGTLVSWIIGGLLSLAAAISFSEIGSMKTGKTSGLPAWAEKVTNSKFGYFVRFNYSFYYCGLLSSALGFFASESFFNVFACFIPSLAIADIPMYVHVIVGLLFSIVIISINFFSIKASGWVQKITTILKWIPLLSVGLLGIILATNNYISGTNGDPRGHNTFTNGRSFTFSGMLAAIPAVLFAFDAFLTAGNLSNKLEGGVKKVPLIVVSGMLFTLFLYLLIAMAAILHGTGYVSSTPLENGGISGKGIFDQLFPKKTAILFGQIVTVFLFISTIGVLNGITSSSVAMIEQSVKTKTIVLSEKLKNIRFIQLYYMYATYTFWFILYAVSAIPLNSDAPVDGLSNFSSLFFFLIYVIVILFYTIKRKKMHETKKINTIIFYIFAWFAIIGTFLVVGYEFIYRFFIDGLFLNPHEMMGWGLFAGKGLESWQGSVIFLSMISLFITGPFINRFLLKKIDKVDSYTKNI